MVAGLAVSTTTQAWTLDGVAIAGATTRDYVVRNADLGHSLRCQVSVETSEGPLTSEPVVLPVVDDGPPRVVHNGASLDCCALNPIIAAMNVPAVIRDTGPVLEALFCSPGTWSG